MKMSPLGKRFFNTDKHADTDIKNAALNVFS